MGEIEGFPMGIHSLQVEQEIEGDDMTVLQHILACDVERTALLKEMEEIINEPEASEAPAKKGKGKGAAPKKSAKTARLAEIVRVLKRFRHPIRKSRLSKF
jgi:hypothetical protein